MHTDMRSFFIQSVLLNARGSAVTDGVDAHPARSQWVQDVAEGKARLTIPRCLVLIVAALASAACAQTTGDQGCAPLQKALAMTLAHPRTSTHQVDDPTQPGLPDGVRIDGKAWSKDFMGGYRRDPDAEAYIATGTSAGVASMEDCTLLGTGELAGQRVKRYGFRLTSGPDHQQVLHVDVKTGRAVYQQYAVDSPGGMLWRFDQDVQEPDEG